MADESFRDRVAALEAVNWVHDVVGEMANYGRTSDEIFAGVQDLRLVVLDWREDHPSMPSGPPWKWSVEALEEYIARRRGDW